MRTIHRIGIGLLVGLFFTAGYAARMNITRREQSARAEKGSRVLLPGMQVAAADLQGAANIDFRPIETLYSVVKNLREHYVEQLNTKDEGLMTYDALRAMLSSLNDPNTRFVDPEQRKVISDAEQGKFHGIGAMLGVKRVKSGDITEEHLIIIASIATGPAATAGLKSGDDIVAVNGKTVLPFDPFQRATKFLKDGRSGKTDRSELRKQLEGEQKRIDNGITIMDAQELLLSEDKKPVELTVLRKGSPKELKLKLEPREFTVAPIASSIIDDGRLGYIKINCFCKNVGDEFATAIDNLKTKGVSGLVLDLRDTASGNTDSVLAVAKQLAPGKKFGVLEQSRGRRSALEIPEQDAKLTWEMPLIVLVDSGTARTPEVLAAALKENGTAKLVGEKTYGDSAFVTLIDENDGAGVLMTTGKLLTSRGVDFTAKGVAVDAVVAVGDQDDTQLKEAVKLLAGERNRS
ncbi:MAG: S41 family peptidase [Armatimonadota bacterium]